jgi:hypothetical protein
VTRLHAVVALSCCLQVASAQEGVEAHFGVIAVAKDGSRRLVETTFVPNVPGQAYGWTARLEPRSEAVSWSEEMVLPKPPRIWGGTKDNPNVSVSADRMIALTRGTIPPGERDFFHFWAVVPGDPVGPYRVELRISDGVVATFHFEVVDSHQ